MFTLAIIGTAILAVIGFFFICVIIYAYCLDHVIYKGVYSKGSRVKINGLVHWF